MKADFLGAMHHQKCTRRAVLGADLMRDICRVTGRVSVGQMFDSLTTGDAQLSFDHCQMFSCALRMGQAVQHTVLVKPKIINLVSARFFGRGQYADRTTGAVIVDGRHIAAAQNFDTAVLVIFKKPCEIDLKRFGQVPNCLLYTSDAADE